MNDHKATVLRLIRHAEGYGNITDLLSHRKADLGQPASYNEELSK